MVPPVQTTAAPRARRTFLDVPAGRYYRRPDVTVWSCPGCGQDLRHQNATCCPVPPTPRREERWILDFRSEARRLGIPEGAARIGHMMAHGVKIPLTSRREAQRLLDHIRHRLASEEPLAMILDEFRPFGASHVLRRAPEWLERRQRLVELGQRSRTGLAVQRQQVRLYWGWWEGVSVGAVTSGALEDWAVWLQQEKRLAPKTVSTVVGGMLTYLRWELRQGTIRRVPEGPEVRVPRVSRYQMPEADQDKVLAAIPEPQRGIFFTLVDCALRPSEARALLAPDYDPEPPGWLYIHRAMDGQSPHHRRDTTKTSTERRVPVSARLAEWIARYVPAEARLEQRPLFPSEGRPGRNEAGGHLSHNWLQTRWRRACKKAGVQYSSVRHNRSARATHLYSRLMESGYSKIDAAVLIQKFLGHANLSTTLNHYMDVEEQGLVKLMEKER